MEELAMAPYFPLHVITDSASSSWDIVTSNPRALWYRRTQEISDFIAHGEIYTALLAVWLMLLSTSIIASHYRRDDREIANSISALPKNSLVLEILSQITRAAAFTYSLLGSNSIAHVIGKSQSLLLFLIFISGLVRVTLVPRVSIWRFRLLHHINLLLVVNLALTIVEVVIPLLIIDTKFRPSGFALCKLASIGAAVAVASVTPRIWRAPSLAFELRHREPEDGASPEETCSWFSYFVSYSWLTRIIMKGSRAGLDFDDLLPLPYYDEPLIWLSKILAARQRFTDTFRTLVSVLRWEIIRMVLCAAITATVEFIAPVAMYQLLHYLEAPNKAIVHPGLWVVLLFVGPMCRSVAFQQYLFGSTRLIVRLRLSMVQELCKKALHSVYFDAFDPSATKDGGKAESIDKKAAKNGHIQNLMSFDVDAIFNSRDLIFVAVTTPIEITMAIVILYNLLSWASLVGLSVLLCSFPLAAFLSKRLSNAQKQVMIATDKRIALISEYLSSIRTIKYFAWEESMSHNIEEARAEEQKWIWRRSLFSMAVAVTGDFTPLLTLFVMLMTYTLGTGNQLSAAVAFSSLTVVEALRTQFVWISNVTNFIAQSTVSFQRIDNYFSTAVECKRHPVGPPAFHNATFRRTPVSEFRLHGLNVEFLENKLNIIMGPSASGKSSLLLSLIGETIMESGDATCPEDVAYASQSAWMMNDTIRNNIVFYQEFEQVRYDAVIEACGLVRDLEAMEDGDMSKVGDNGSTLSGGQRQRIALARCFYSKSPLLLLDDIFSALDVETAAHVWKNAFHGELINSRTVILVTQQQWLAEEADIAIMLQGGEIVSIEHHDHSGRAATPKTPHISGSQTPMTQDLPPAIPSKTQDDTMASMKQENATQGRNERLLFYQYMYQFGGHSFALFTVAMSLFAQMAFFGITLWISVWVGQYGKDQAVNVGYYIGVYAAVLTTFALLSIGKDMTFRWGAWNAARISHSRLVKSIMAVSLDWFDANPAGRAINRFSQDMTSIDLRCVDYLRQSTDNALRLVLRIGGVGSIMPIFALPAALVCCIGFAVGELYTKSQVPTKKMVSASNSPIFSQFQDTMSGLSVIRARGMQDVFSDLLARRLRSYARASQTMFNLNRWVSVRADVSAASVAFMAGLLAIYKSGSVSPGLVGFSLTNAIGLSSTILFLVRNMNELEIELNCFHRVREYADLTPEESPNFTASKGIVGRTPEEPVIEFRNVTARYSDDGLDVLKNVSFKIRAGERIAIVGRTGSGKSTTVLCLLRFVHISSGQILIDGLDINEMALAELRKDVTMIPQEPVLFSGTVRSNLDPTNKINEAVVAHALQACSSITAISTPHKSSDSMTTTLVDISSSSSSSHTEYPHGDTSRINLTTHISPRGDNFSQGERQILGVARAIARQSKIVLMDEATASVDYESDKAIQEVLKNEFVGRTVITIAHRLMGVIGYDRILVMGGGEVLELDTPKALYQQKGVFWSMVQQSAESAELQAILESESRTAPASIGARV